MSDINNILPLNTVEDAVASLCGLVRLARQREEWTQADLARRSGVPMTTISRLERTDLASTDTVFKVLFALNTEPDDYFLHRLGIASLTFSNCMWDNKESNT